MLDLDQIDIRENLLTALGFSDRLHDQIDKIYNEKPLDYYELYKNSFLYNSPIFNTYTTRKNEAMRKVTGIYIWDQQFNKQQLTLSLIKKGYKVSWDYYEQRRLHRFIDFQDFGRYYYQLMERKKADGINNELLFHHHKVVLLYLCWYNEKPYDLDNPIGEILLNELYFQKVTADKTGVKLKDEEQIIYEQSRERLYKKYSFPEKQSMFTLQDVVIKIHLNQMMEIKDREGITITDSSQLEDLRIYSYQEGINKHFSSLLRSIKMLGLNADDFISSCSLTMDEVDRLIHQYVLNKLSNSLADEDEDAHISALFLIYAFINEYKRTKEIYFHRMKEEHFKEITDFKLKLKKKEEEIKKQQYKMSLNESRITNETKLLKQEIDRLLKLNKEYELQLKNTENNSKEVQSLRNYLFSNENKDIQLYDDDDRLVEKINSLKMVRAAVIGGHLKWQQKLKGELRNFHFVNPENKGMDLQFIDQLDIVFFNTATNSHAFYEKFIKRMRNNDTALHYINQNFSLELTINEMYRGAKEAGLLTE